MGIDDFSEVLEEIRKQMSREYRKQFENNIIFHHDSSSGGEITLSGNKIEPEGAKKLAKVAAFHLYDFIGQFEEEIDDEKIDDMEKLIQKINNL